MTYRPLPGVRRLLVDLDGDDLFVQRGGAALLLVRDEVLVLTPRLVVVLRVPSREATIERLCTDEGCAGTPLD